jgi:hypothetical protein
VVEVQRQLDELALTIPDRIPTADFCLIESDFAGFAPGEYIEEAVEFKPAISVIAAR